MGHKIAYFRDDWPIDDFDFEALRLMETAEEKLDAMFCRVKVRDDGSYVMANLDAADAAFPGSDAVPYTQENHGAVLYDSIPEAIEGCLTDYTVEVAKIGDEASEAVRQAFEDIQACSYGVALLQSVRAQAVLLHAHQPVE